MERSPSIDTANGEIVVRFRPNHSAEDVVIGVLLTIFPTCFVLSQVARLRAFLSGGYDQESADVVAFSVVGFILGAAIATYMFLSGQWRLFGVESVRTTRGSVIIERRIGPLHYCRTYSAHDVCGFHVEQRVFKAKGGAPYTRQVIGFRRGDKAHFLWSHVSWIDGQRVSAELSGWLTAQLQHAADG